MNLFLHFLMGISDENDDEFGHGPQLEDIHFVFFTELRSVELGLAFLKYIQIKIMFWSYM